eukprot:gene15443-20837_t
MESQVPSLILVSPTGEKVLEEAVARIEALWGELSLKTIEPGEALHLSSSDGDTEEAVSWLDGLPLDISSKPPERMGLLVADMDSTIIGCECLDELADFANKKAEVSAITERAMAGELDFEGALTERVAMLTGLELTALQACYEARVDLNPGAEVFVRTMAHLGAHCALVSGGFSFFTSRVAARAGFHTNRANQLLDDGTCLTGKVGMPILASLPRIGMPIL